MGAPRLRQYSFCLTFGNTTLSHTPKRVVMKLLVQGCIVCHTKTQIIKQSPWSALLPLQSAFISHGFSPFSSVPCFSVTSAQICCSYALMCSPRWVTKCGDEAEMNSVRGWQGVTGGVRNNGGRLMHHAWHRTIVIYELILMTLESSLLARCISYIKCGSKC